MNIYITRHGQTIWNKEGRIQGHKDSELTEKGINDAELLSERIQELSIDYIISSPIKRAYRTAEIVRGNKALEIIFCEYFKEINCGDFEGEKFEDLAIKFPEQFIKIKENPFQNGYPNGENLIQFYDRVIEGFNKIIDSYKDKNILIVGHGGTIKCIETYIHKNKIQRGWFDSIVENCSFTHIRLIENGFEIIAYNDILHLQKEMAEGVV